MEPGRSLALGERKNKITDEQNPKGSCSSVFVLTFLLRIKKETLISVSNAEGGT